MYRLRATRRYVLAALLLLLGTGLAAAARSTPRSRRRKKERRGEFLPGSFLVIVKYLTLCVFGPAVLFFIYRYISQMCLFLVSPLAFVALFSSSFLCGALYSLEQALYPLSSLSVCLSVSSNHHPFPPLSFF